MLASSTLGILDDYWAGFFGVARERLRPAAPLVVAHGELGDYTGMYAQWFGAAPIVSLPAQVLDVYGRAVADAVAGGLVDDERWSRVFGEALERVIGRAEVH